MSNHTLNFESIEKKVILAKSHSKQGHVLDHNTTNAALRSSVSQPRLVRPMPRPLYPIHGPFQKSSMYSACMAPVTFCGSSGHASLIVRATAWNLQPAQRGGHQVILPGQPPRQQVDGDDARERQQGAHAQRQATG